MSEHSLSRSAGVQQHSESSSRSTLRHHTPAPAPRTMLRLGSVLVGFQEPEWSDCVVPGSAGPDIKMFARERRVIPVTVGVLQATAKTGELVDCVGGEMLLVGFQPQGADGLLGSTWAGLCVVANAEGSAITYRAFRGSMLDKIAKSARTDIHVNGNNDTMTARRHTIDSGAVASPYVPRSKGDGKLLHDWAMRSLHGRLVLLCLPRAQGGLGFPPEMIRTDGVLLLVGMLRCSGASLRPLPRRPPSL